LIKLKPAYLDEDKLNTFDFNDLSAANDLLNFLLPNPGRFAKGDRKEQNSDRQSQNQDVGNTFHIENLPGTSTENSLSRTEERSSAVHDLDHGK
jgi:hypothetical protein